MYPFQAFVPYLCEVSDVKGKNLLISSSMIRNSQMIIFHMKNLTAGGANTFLIG